MIAYRILGLLRLQILAQCLIVAAIYWAWFWILGHLIYSEPFLVGSYLNYWIVAEIALLLESFSRETERRNLLRRGLARSPHTVFRQLLYMAAGISLFLVLTKDAAISRMFLVTFLGISTVALSFSEYFLSRVLSRAVFGDRRKTRTILMGSAQSILGFQQWAHEKKMYGLEIVGALSDDRESAFIGMLAGMRIGDTSSLGRKLAAHKVDQLVLVDAGEDTGKVREMIRLCERHGIRFVLVNDMSAWTGKRLASRNLDGMNLMFLYEEPLEDPFNQMLKRAFDIAVALAACLTVLPLASLMVAMIHRIQSPGRLFFKQHRTGIKGAPFEIYKFRTLHERDHDEGKQVSDDDKRVFRWGWFLRKFSIDELPQFINVLKGEMSVIGPRPHFLEHDAYFAKLLENYRTRSLVKPGITGLAQVRGQRGNTEGCVSHIQERIQSDITYLENWSLRLDFLILFRTIYHMFFPPRSAY